MTFDMILDGSDLIGYARTGQDHLERNNSDFGSLKFRVLDEADEMLRMGFVEDVELILGQDNAANVSLEVRGRFGDGGRGGFRRGGGGFFG
ncbi:hypothetical protein LWI28_019412 [Acer negundo]|uniref:DEAD/DEAH-box helicase domain-containing protein n=1 Tax=Acer negundo TaxID=4023 RepID=A0AAD5NJW3_ACENE|nr:hypothetical protein LWI28_019412 [Acer negundo]